MSLHRRRLVCAGVLAFAWVKAARAHRGHQTLSLVDVDARGEVRITHTLTAHNTEPELARLAPAANPSVDDPDALKALLDHLAGGFTVNGSKADLLSYYLGSDTLTFVYRARIALAGKGLPQRFTIDYKLFAGSYSAPVGLVQVRYRGATKSLQCVPGAAPLSVDF